MCFNRSNGLNSLTAKGLVKAALEEISEGKELYLWLNPKIPFSLSIFKKGFKRPKKSSAYLTKYNLNKICLFIATEKYILIHICVLYVYLLPNYIFLKKMHVLKIENNSMIVVDF